MADIPELVIGRRADARLTLRVLHRENPEATDYDDGNWLTTEIGLRVGGFKAKVRASLCAPDFRDLRAGLRRTLKGEVRFETMESWLSFAIAADGRGHFILTGILVDDPGSRNRLTFGLDFDQTDIPEMLFSLEAICKGFPVRGSPAV